MENRKKNQSSRRQFITKSIPACALSVLALSQLKGAIPTEISEATQGETMLQDAMQSQHLFDKRVTSTIRQIFASSGRKEINLINPLVEVFGKDKVIKILKDIAYKRAKSNGERYKKNNGTNDFETFKKRFLGPGSYTESLIIAETIENSDTALELKVSECVIAEEFIKQGVGDLGYAYHCYGDHYWQDGYNTKIKLIRDKTLMEGDAYCNHRYVFEG
ncbi:MAG: L-2-amino-thiazoline-4-carboxylic acid hydrolase [Bacteroidetes bacterium]|nr:L-2-amino-thiazoline-4-carboxylic acid hydrolase [Bacteroidota bacterium]